MQSAIQTPRAPSPAAVGGQDIPSGLISQQNLRILRGFVESFNWSGGDRRDVRIPSVGYIKQLRYFVTGTITVAGQTSQNGVVGDPRRLVRMSTTSFGAANRPHDLDGVSENLFNQLDLPVLNPKSVFPASGFANGNHPVNMEFTVQYPISEVNLLGLIYNGGESTYMTHNVSMAPLADVLTVGTGGTATFTGRVEVWMEWVDEVEPIPERPMVDEQGNQYVVPGQGLWRETSMIKYQQLHASVELVSPGQPFDVDLPRGPIYDRVMLVVTNTANGALDTGDVLLDTVELSTQQIATIRSENQLTLDNDYRTTYLKTRPGGVYVLTFLDKTGSDRDLLFTAGLGRVQIKGRLKSGVAVPAGSRLSVFTETIVSLDRNSAY